MRNCCNRIENVITIFIISENLYYALETWRVLLTCNTFEAVVIDDILLELNPYGTKSF